MEENRKKTTDEIERDVIFSHAIKAGKRIYYMDVRKTRKEELYLSITESKKKINGDGDDAQISFEKHKIFLYREDFSNFIDGLTKTVKFISEYDRLPHSDHTQEVSSDVQSEDRPSQAQTADDSFEIEF